MFALHFNGDHDVPMPLGLDKSAATHIGHLVILDKVKLAYALCTEEAADLCAQCGADSTSSRHTMTIINELLNIAINKSRLPRGSLHHKWSQICCAYNTYFTKSHWAALHTEMPIKNGSDPIVILGGVGVPEKTLDQLASTKIEVSAALAQLKLLVQIFKAHVQGIMPPVPCSPSSDSPRILTEADIEAIAERTSQRTGVNLKSTFDGLEDDLADLNRQGERLEELGMQSVNLGVRYLQKADEHGQLLLAQFKQGQLIRRAQEEDLERAVNAILTGQSVLATRQEVRALCLRYASPRLALLFLPD